MKKQLVLSFCWGIFLFTSCGEVKISGEETAKEQVAQEQDIRKISMEIGGMTCEIGCAKLIESKLSKASGVENVKINFENKIGELSYDANQTSEKEIVKFVEDIADGGLYQVVSVNKFE